MTDLKDVYSLLEEIKKDVADAFQRLTVSGNQVYVVEGLSDISKRLGLIQAGEFRVGNGEAIGKGFSGVRIGYPAFTYSGEAWNIVGVNNDVLQVGIRSSDGKLIAAGGDVIIDYLGVGFKNQTGKLTFETLAGQWQDVYISINDTDYLTFVNGTGHAGFGFVVDSTANYSMLLRIYEDPTQAERLLLECGDEEYAQGVRFEMGNGLIDFRTQGTSGGSTFMRMRETTTTPPVPGNSLDAFHLYMKGNLLIIQSNNGGTLHYRYIDLSGTSTTWVYSATAP